MFSDVILWLLTGKVYFSSPVISGEFKIKQYFFDVFGRN